MNNCLIAAAAAAAENPDRSSFMKFISSKHFIYIRRHLTLLVLSITLHYLHITDYGSKKLVHEWEWEFLISHLKDIYIYGIWVQVHNAIPNRCYIKREQDQTI